MPKNAAGQVTCINHPEQVMYQDASLYSFEKVIPLDGDYAIKGGFFPVNVYACEICGYVETYRLKK